MNLTVTPTGHNLTAFVGGELTQASDWLCFATWYTVKQHWPDAKVVVSLPKRVFSELLFRWLDRCKVRRYFRRESVTPQAHFANLIREGELSPPCMFVPDHCLMLREPTPKELCQLNQAKFLVSGEVQFLGGSKELGDVDAPWLAADDVASQPVMLTHGDKVGGFDITAWDAKTKIAPFGATWEAKDSTERRVQQAWNSMFNYHAMATR